MSDRGCRSCGAKLDLDARFCAQCGVRVESGAQRGAQLVAAGVILLELLSMGVMSGFTVPRLRASIADFGATPSGTFQLLLHPAWLPTFMVGVAIVGGFEVFKRMSTVQRVLLVSTALMIGLIPMFGTVGAIYLIPFQIAAGIGN